MEVVPGRLAAVHLATLAKGGVVGYSVYLYPSEGMTERNREILDKLGQHAAAHGKVWVAGGDWNMDPESLCTSRWPEKLKAYVKATVDPRGTCNKGDCGSNLDYFLVDHRLKHVVGEPRIVEAIRPNPHRPVEVIVQGRAHTYYGWYRVKPRNVPVKWFIGPRRKPMEEEWGRVREMMKEAEESLKEMKRGSKGAGEKLVGTLEKWTEVAEQELAASNDIFEQRGKYVGRNNCKFSWKPVLGWRAREMYQTSSQVGAAWRWVHSHLSEAVKLEWSRRRRGGRMQEGLWDREEVLKYRRQTEHLARLLVRVGQRGAGTLKEVEGGGGGTNGGGGSRGWRWRLPTVGGWKLVFWRCGELRLGQRRRLTRRSIGRTEWPGGGSRMGAKGHIGG